MATLTSIDVLQNIESALSLELTQQELKKITTLICDLKKIARETSQAKNQL